MNAEDYEFPIFQFRDMSNGDELLNICHYVYMNHDLFETLAIVPAIFHKYIRVI